MSYLQITMVGNLGKAPELRYMPSGAGICNFNVATNESYTKKDGEKVAKVTWMRVSVFGNQAEACNTYLHAGSKVLVTGRLSPDDKGNPRMWETNGEKKASYEMKADRVIFLDRKGEQTQNTQPAIVDADDQIAF